MKSFARRELFFERVQSKSPSDVILSKMRKESSGSPVITKNGFITSKSYY
jgi:hypothetical protein